MHPSPSSSALLNACPAIAPFTMGPLCSSSAPTGPTFYIALEIASLGSSTGIITSNTPSTLVLPSPLLPAKSPSYPSQPAHPQHPNYQTLMSPPLSPPLHSHLSITHKSHASSSQLTAWAYQLSNKHLTLHERLERSNWEDIRLHRRTQVASLERLGKGESLPLIRKRPTKENRTRSGKKEKKDRGDSGKKMRNMIQLNRWLYQVADQEITVGEMIEKRKWE